MCGNGIVSQIQSHIVSGTNNTSYHRVIAALRSAPWPFTPSHSLQNNFDIYVPTIDPQKLADALGMCFCDPHFMGTLSHIERCKFAF